MEGALMDSLPSLQIVGAALQFYNDIEKKTDRAHGLPPTATSPGRLHEPLQRPV